MSFGIPVRNGLGIGLRASTTLSTRSGGAAAPAISLDFLAGAPLDSRITFTRASTATFVGSNGLIQSAAIDAPRFDYDPTTLAAEGLLIEEQRTNLLAYSDQFNNAAWDKTNVTVTANATTSPDGTANADAVFETTTTGFHSVNSFATIVVALSGQTYTASFYIKANGRTKGFMSVVSGGGFVTFDITAKTITFGGNGTNETVIAQTITESSNGWFRLTMTSSFSGAANVKPTLGLSNDAGNSSYTGDVSKGVFLYGAQLEAGSFPTSYIPTGITQVTRSADVATITGTNFSSWFNATQGTFIFAGDSAYGSGGFIGSTPTTGAILYANANASRTSNGTNVITTANTYANNAVFNTALGYSASGRSLVLNGGTIATDANLIQTPTAITLGGAFGGNYLNGHARAISFYNTRLSNATLQALTT